MNKAIGGYFELELKQGEHFHKNALKLNTARNCLEYILKAKGYKKIYIPYYTCEVILEPIKKLNVDYEFYSINQKLEPVKEYKLSEHEAFLYTNYFGLKQDTVASLAACYGINLIVDNAQAFFAKPVENIDTFYSARKFFGVPDGAYLYTDQDLDEDLEQDSSYMRMSHLLKRADIGAETGFADFRQNDDSLVNQPIKRMSNLTERILIQIDYEKAGKTRKENFMILDQALRETNLFQFQNTANRIPMIYPYWCEKKDLRKYLIEHKIFVPTYWKNVLEWSPKDALEQKFTEEVIFLPIDQRWNKNDMEYIIKHINL